MTNTDRIKQMAQEAGSSFDPTFESVGANPAFIMSPEELARFAQLVAEDCARVAVECRNDVIIADNRRPEKHQNSSEWAQGVYGLGSVIAHEICARYSLATPSQAG